MAWIKQTVGEGRRIQPSDRYDIDHYANASYVDLMVTNDRRFLGIYAIIPDPPFQVETFQDFVTARLGVS